MGATTVLNKSKNYFMGKDLSGIMEAEGGLSLESVIAEYFRQTGEIPDVEKLNPGKGKPQEINITVELNLGGMFEAMSQSKSSESK